MTNVNYAALREHHSQGARYEKLREAWFKCRGDGSMASLCGALSRDHANSADLALMGARSSESPKRKR